MDNMQRKFFCFTVGARGCKNVLMVMITGKTAGDAPEDFETDIIACMDGPKGKHMERFTDLRVILSQGPC